VAQAVADGGDVGVQATGGDEGDRAPRLGEMGEHVDAVGDAGLMPHAGGQRQSAPGVQRQQRGGDWERYLLASWTATQQQAAATGPAEQHHRA
jgi:hypothetical protein